jgi:hypothetical protein
MCRDDSPTVYAKVSMTITTVSLLTLAATAVAGLATWTWIGVARAFRELRSFDDLEGMHFER